MTAARVLPFVRNVVPNAGRSGSRRPVSPFAHLLPARPLTPREILHRQRMLRALYERRGSKGHGGRLFAVRAAADAAVGPERAVDRRRHWPVYSQP